MKYRIEVTFEVNPKYAKHVSRRFNEFLKAMPDQIAGIKVEKCNAEQISQHDGKGKGSGGRSGGQAGKVVNA